MILMNDDDEPNRTQYSVKPAESLSSAEYSSPLRSTVMHNLSESSLSGGLRGRAQRTQSVEDRFGA